MRRRGVLQTTTDGRRRRQTASNDDGLSDASDQNNTAPTLCVGGPVINVQFICCNTYKMLTKLHRYVHVKLICQHTEPWHWSLTTISSVRLLTLLFLIKTFYENLFSCFVTRQLLLWYYYFAPDRMLSYCDQRVCMLVCPSVCLSARISQKSHVQISRNVLYM